MIFICLPRGGEDIFSMWNNQLMCVKEAPKGFVFFFNLFQVNYLFQVIFQQNFLENTPLLFLLICKTTYTLLPG